MKGAADLWPLLILACSHSTAATKTTSSIQTSTTPATCPARTINHLTHTLPQQCLTSPRALSNATTSLSESSSVTASLTEPQNGTRGSTNTSQTITDVSVDVDATPEPSRAEPVLLEVGRELDVAESVPTVAVDILKPSVDLEDDDSVLGGGSFLSFEDWKRQNLKKTGQSEHIGQQRAQGDPGRRRPQNSLESLGDDGEIDIDFSGFVPGGTDSSNEVYVNTGDTAIPSQGSEDSARSTLMSRKKDAGTTCKERFNFASFDCAATVLKTNKEAKSPNTVLIENKDSYMLNKCAAPEKFIILELCQDILIDTVVLANFEFFSSTFRQFRVSVSDRYPVKNDKWKSLGLYEARNSRQVQAFLVESTIWARYLRIDFLSHYGNEFYCPVSLVRVHGTTMMDDFRHDQYIAQGVEEDEDSRLTDETVPTAEAIDKIEPSPDRAGSEFSNGSTDHTESGDIAEASRELEPSRQSLLTTQSKDLLTQDIDHTLPASMAAIEAIMSVIEPTDTCISGDVSHSALATDQPSQHTSNTLPAPAYSASTPQTTAKSNSSSTLTSHSPITTTQSSMMGDVHNVSQPISRVDTQTTIHSPAIENLSSSASSRSVTSNNETTISSSSRAKTSSSASSAPGATSTEKAKTSTGTQVHLPSPSAQDSFFKSVQKRLQMLEANSTMSLQYIEDQSRALRDAFKKVEQRQIARTSTFLQQLNQTVLTELRDFRQQYDQLWQSTVIELELQRERYERDNEAINTRIGILADEVIFQRRLAILQMLLILVCLMLVLFSRPGALQGYLEMPIVANVLAKSPSSKWLNLSSDSLARITPTRPRSAQQLRSERTGLIKGHQRIESEDSITDVQSGNELYAPPTPVSDYHSEVDLSRDEDEKDVGSFDDPEFDPSAIERPLSSPPTLVLNSGVDREESAPLNLASDDSGLGVTTGNILSDVSNTSRPSRHLTWNLPEATHLE